MAASYLPYLPDQDFLLPHSMREWLPEGHLACYINETVDSLDHVRPAARLSTKEGKSETSRTSGDR